MRCWYFCLVLYETLRQNWLGTLVTHRQKTLTHRDLASIPSRATSVLVMRSSLHCWEFSGKPVRDCVLDKFLQSEC